MRIESETVQATSQDAPVVQNMIQLENVSVEYRIPTERIGTLKEFMIRYLQRRVGFRKFRALDNVSLSIHKGEVFGIVGNNGAGSGAIDVAMTVLAMHRGVIPPSASTSQPDPDCGLKVVTGDPIDARVEVALSTASALSGGQTAALVIRRYHA